MPFCKSPAQDREGTSRSLSQVLYTIHSPACVHMFVPYIHTSLASIYNPYSASCDPVTPLRPTAPVTRFPFPLFLRFVSLLNLVALASCLTLLPSPTFYAVCNHYRTYLVTPIRAYNSQGLYPKPLPLLLSIAREKTGEGEDACAGICRLPAYRAAIYK